ncbi:MAG: helix-turn-helix transcriptional regulator [Oenococcus oeni]
MQSVNDIVIKKINEALEENHISKAELARRVNVSRATITQWLNGSNGIKQSSLEAIAKVLHHEIAWFFTENIQEGNQPELSSKQVTLAMSIDPDVSDEELKQAIDYIKFMHTQRIKKNDTN